MFGGCMKNAKLTKFDGQTRKDHAYLRAEDDCYYLIEYTARRAFNYSEANNFISNFKKKPSVKATYQWKHKLIAIRQAAETLSSELSKTWLKKSTFVPVPPSKSRKHPEYDDRMSKVLQKLQGADVRELVYQAKGMEATHVSTDRHSIEELVANYRIDEDLSDPEPKHIVIVDDMMTAGAHYRAMRRVLRKRFSKASISGVFLARRIFASNEAGDEDDE
jgi:predicted amidophosphoribosyltransferase